MANREVFYLNRATGEVTENHNEAVDWYRQGMEVEVYCNGKFSIAWEF